MFDTFLQLLQEKAELFIQYEQETRQLITDDPEQVDAIVAAVENRQELIDDIDTINTKLITIRDTSAKGRRLFDISMNQCDYSSLNEGERVLYEKGQQIFSTLTRIRELESRGTGNMEKIRDFLQEKIKQSNTNVKFSGYLKQMDQKSKGMLYDKKR